MSETTLPPPPPRILIGTPCTDQVQAGFALDLAMLFGLMCAEGSYQCVLMQNRGTILPQQRATLVTQAIEVGASHLLFVDSDMRFPKDALLRLLAHHEPIVAANYPRRRHPVLPTAEDRERGHLFTEPATAGLVPVTQCGMGLMLIEMGVFAHLPEPWFQIGYTGADAQYVGEDFYFCHKARSAGFEILIDQTLSQEIRHVGSIDYTHAHTLQARDALLARQSAENLAHTMGREALI